MQFDVVGGSYTNKYISLNPQKTINWYIHKQLLEDEKGKFQHSLQPTPGMTAFCDTAASILRKKSFFVARTLDKERAFVVGDNYLYEVFSDGTCTSLGQMTAMDTTNTPVWMACNSENQVMICHTTASYIFDMDTDALVQITDSDFPASPTSLAYLQGYFIVAAGGRVYYSAPLNGLSWTATDVFTPSAYSDKTIAAIIWRDDVHCFGTETIEIYVFDGTTPFIKQDRSTINIGLVSTETLAVFADGVIFLGQTKTGQSKVYFYNGQTCTAISDSNIDWQINNPAALGGTTWDLLLTYTWDAWFDAWGTGLTNAYAEIQYTRDGHILYLLSISALHTTFCFDVTSQEWTERQSTYPGTSQQLEFRGLNMVNFQGLNLWSDAFSGKILKEDYTNRTEDSNQITRTRITQILAQEKTNISIYSFELDMTTGVGLTAAPSTPAYVQFSYSRNGGNTYGAVTNLNTGAAGQYQKRVRLNKLGTARDWVFKLVVTDAADLAINSGIMTGITGSS